MTTAKTLLTADDLLKLPDDGHRYELIDGELKEVTPPGLEHGELLLNFGTALKVHVRSGQLGRVLGGDPGIIVRRNPDRVRGPDICFYAAGRLPEGRLPRGYSEVIPDLVIEIVSPGDTASDVQEKVTDWIEAGVQLVWTVYPAPRQIVAYRSLTDIRVYVETETIDAAPVLPDFACPVAELFS